MPYWTWIVTGLVRVMNCSDATVGCADGAAGAETDGGATEIAGVGAAAADVGGGLIVPTAIFITG